MTSSPPSVLLVDDHPLFRTGLRMMLSTSELVQADFHEAGSIAEAVALDAPVDLVLLDISMPGCDGLSGMARLRERWPQVPVVILSGHDHQELMHKAVQSGAVGFLSKAWAPEVICAQVQHCLGQQGGAEPMQAPPDRLGRPAGAGGSLPPRQYEVLKLMAQGFSNKAIAKRMDVSEYTVRNQVVNILRHFDAQTRTQAVTTAQRQGVLPAFVSES
ncbi:response regulator transcription factor [Comamonas humi]